MKSNLDWLLTLIFGQMSAAAASFKDLSFSDPGKKAAIGKKLIEGLGKDNAASWSASDVAK